MELIPGLPNEIAMECLIRVPFTHISKALSVCKDWKIAIQQPEFWHRRKAAGLTRPLIALSQSRWVDPNQIVRRDSRRLIYQLSICDPEEGFLYEVPPIPGFSEGLPMFCQVVGVGRNLVVIGGFDPLTWKTLSSVFIYDFATATWRDGAAMPDGGTRSFFGCASGYDRMVLVAGGHDGNKNALRSAMMYDVADDKWTILPDMARERDECRCIFHCGRFHVIGGYCTESQGGFERSAEAFDIGTCQWDQLEDFLLDATRPINVASNGHDRLYTCSEGDVLELENMTWKILVGLPADVYDVLCLTAWQKKVFAIGSARSNVPRLNAYVIDLANSGLTRTEIPDEHLGHVQCGCFLEI